MYFSRHCLCVFLSTILELRRNSYASVRQKAMKASLSLGLLAMRSISLLLYFSSTTSWFSSWRIYRLRASVSSSQFWNRRTMFLMTFLVSLDFSVPDSPDFGSKVILRRCLGLSGTFSSSGGWRTMLLDSSGRKESLILMVRFPKCISVTLERRPRSSTVKWLHIYSSSVRSGLISTSTLCSWVMLWLLHSNFWAYCLQVGSFAISTSIT